MFVPAIDPEWASVSAVLNRIGDNSLALRSDSIIVNCFTEEMQETDNELGVAWFVPATNSIYLNISKIKQAVQDVFKDTRRTRPVKFYPRDIQRKLLLLDKRDTAYYDCPTYVTIPSRHLRDSYIVEKDGSISETTVEEHFMQSSKNPDDTYHGYAYLAPYVYESVVDREDPSDVFVRCLLGAYFHETSHSVFSTFLDTDWFNEKTPYEKKLIIQFEELRVERNQLYRMGCNPSVVRGAADLVVSAEKSLENIDNAKDHDNKDEAIAQIAINSILIVGRKTYDVFDESEVSDLNDALESLIGQGRFEAAVDIMDGVSQIYQLNTEAIDSYVRQWMDLFPLPEGSDGSDITATVCSHFDPENGEGEENDESSESEASSSGKDGDDDNNGTESTSSSGKYGHKEKSEVSKIISKVVEGVDKAVDAAKRDPKNTTAMSRPMSPRKAYIKANSRKVSSLADRGFKDTPIETWERISMKKLADKLRKMNTTERGRFVVNSEIPPGKLNTRAVIQHRAEKKFNPSARSRAWSRTKHVTGDNPPLTVGVATDISGSMTWSEGIAASLSWILPRAISEINGKVSAVTFGDATDIVVYPNTTVEKKYCRSAGGGTETMNSALGSLDYMLNLSNGSGVRILFVFTDGILVAPGEMEATAKKVEQLAERGVHVFWATPEHAIDDSFNGYPQVPKMSIPIVYTGSLGYGASADAIRDRTEKFVDTVGNTIVEEFRKARARS